MMSLLIADDIDNPQQVSYFPPNKDDDIDNQAQLVSRYRLAMTKIDNRPQSVSDIFICRWGYEIDNNPKLVSDRRILYVEDWQQSTVISKLWFTPWSIGW